MKYYRLSYLLFFLLPGGAVPALFATEQTSIPFAQARKLILAENAGLKATGTEVEAAAAAVFQAGLRPNPTITIALDKFGANEIELAAEQTFELGDKRTLRKTAATSEVATAKNTHDRTLLELEAEIIRRFIPIAAAENRLVLIDSIIANAEATKTQIENRVRAGAARKTDLIRADIEMEQLLLERSTIKSTQEQARKHFARLGGEQGASLENVTGELAENPELPALDTLFAALDSTPQLHLFDLEQLHLDIEQKQLRADVTPDLDVTFGFLRNNLDNYHSPLVGASLTLPLFNKNTARIKQAELTRKAIGEKRDNTLQQIKSQLEELYGRVFDIDRRIATLSQNTLPKAIQLHELTLEYYLLGSSGFLDLAASQAEMFRFKIDIHDLKTERAQTLAAIMQLSSFSLKIIK